MKSLLSVLFITGFLLFYPYPSVRAEVTGPPDVTTKVPIPNLIKFGETGTDSEGNSFLKSLLPSNNRPIGGILGPEGSQVNKPIVDEPSVHRELGTQLEIARPYFTSDTIGERIQNISGPYTYTITSTLCYASDNEHTQAFPIKKRITYEAKKLPELRENARIFAGLLAPNVNIEQAEYERFNDLNPNVLGEILEKPECDEPPSSRSVPKERAPTSEAEFYEVPPEKLPIYFVDKWINFFTSVVGKKCSETDCSASANPFMNALLKLKMPYFEKIMVDTTNDPRDPNSKPIGFIPTFVSDYFRISNEHGNVSGQTIEQKVGSNSEPVKNVNLIYPGAKTLTSYKEIMNCSLYPDNIQSDNLNHSCNFSENDVTADRTLIGGANANFTFGDPKFESLNKEINDATQGKIPACVLEGVKYIETGDQTDFSGACPVNVCSAAGPYQVTTGAAPASGGGWDTHCTQCGSLWSDGSKDCPDGWPGDWPKNGGHPSPCSDTKAAARRAVEMLQEKAVIRCESLDTTRSIQEQRTAIITAAGSYYGANTPIPRLGGCSYGEFVYKHCDSSYVCGTANVDLGVKWDQCQAQKKL